MDSRDLHAIGRDRNEPRGRRSSSTAARPRLHVVRLANVEKSLEQAVADRRLGDRCSGRGVGCMRPVLRGPLVQMRSIAEPGRRSFDPRRPPRYGRRAGDPSILAAWTAAATPGKRRPESARSSPRRCKFHRAETQRLRSTRNASRRTSPPTATRRCTTCCAK